MTNIIECNSFSKSYGIVEAVKSLNLQVKPGEIYAFCGLNGAGKTTTIRGILGMLQPSSGNISLFGETISPLKQGPWHRVGYLVERPTAYPDLTVYENLEIARRLQRYQDQHATSRVIELLGITPYINRKAGKLSTGNLQRLGLARALLHHPELLLLDEPANGLDPAGVVEIRSLLSRLTKQDGVTIFMSSHILSEVDRLATRIGFIHQGVLLEELDKQKLNDLRSPHLVVKSRDLKAARDALTQSGFNVETHPECISLDQKKAIQHPDEIAALLVQAGAPPTHLSIEQEDLESHFLRITGATL